MPREKEKIVMNHPSKFIGIAIGEAKVSLKEGNSGFGAVIIKNNVLISKAHDTDTVTKDPTSHAEMSVIRQASQQLAGAFTDCMLISTHEPCPMCSTAIVWSGIGQIAFGYSIKDSLGQGRKRIDLTCEELFKRAEVEIEVIRDVNKQECSVLYNRQVRKNIEQLRGADSAKLAQLSEKLRDKRIRWFKEQNIQQDTEDPLHAAYLLFLQKLDIDADEAPIVDKQKNRLVIHSKNFCPTLEACKILDLDTRTICRELNEKPTQALLQQLNPGLLFKRNYNCLRPFTPYCEEMIIMEGYE